VVLGQWDDKTCAKGTLVSSGSVRQKMCEGNARFVWECDLYMGVEELSKRTSPLKETEHGTGGDSGDAA